jgi:hypothetical protein
VKEMLYETRSQRSEDSDKNSVASGGSRRRGTRDLSPDERSRGGPSSRPLKNQPPTLRIDPADIYAQEVEKLKAKKLFSVSELKREMEDLKKQGYGNFDIKKSMKNEKKKQSIKAPAPVMPKNTFMKKPEAAEKPKGPGLGRLDQMQPKARPGFADRQTSFRTAASGQGLLTGAHAGFDKSPLQPTIAEKKEDAFMGGNRPSTFGNGGGGFGGGTGMGVSPAMPGQGFNAGFGTGRMDNSGFGQDPLPLPDQEMRDDEGKKRRFLLSVKSEKFGKKIMGKSANFFSNIRGGPKRQSDQGGMGGMGGMIDDGGGDSDSEGGMGLLG